MTTEISVYNDRLLKSYRWFIAIADNENIKADTRMEAQREALKVAATLFELEQNGPKVIRNERWAHKILYPNSKSAEGDMSV
jgi:hypothetical protein